MCWAVSRPTEQHHGHVIATLGGVHARIHKYIYISVCSSSGNRALCRLTLPAAQHEGAQQGQGGGGRRTDAHSDRVSCLDMHPDPQMVGRCGCRWCRQAGREGSVMSLCVCMMYVC